jgi:hypothetical protein
LVAIIGYRQAEDREKFQAAGFDAQLVKRVDLRQFRALMMANPLAKASNGTETPWRY